jgi:hypothetical protein
VSTPIVINGGKFNENQKQPIMFFNQGAMECIKNLILERAFNINVKYKI